MKDDNLGRDEKKHVAKKWNAGKRYRRYAMENMYKKDQEKYRGCLYAKLEYVKKIMGKEFEKLLEPQKYM